MPAIPASLSRPAFASTLSGMPLDRIPLLFVAAGIALAVLLWLVRLRD